MRSIRSPGAWSQPDEDEAGGVGDLDVSGFGGVTAGCEIDAELFLPARHDVGIVVDGVEEDERFGDCPGELGSPVDGRQELEDGFEDFVVIVTCDLPQQDAVVGQEGRPGRVVTEDECLGVPDVDQADVAIDCAGLSWPTNLCQPVSATG